MMCLKKNLKIFVVSGLLFNKYVEKSNNIKNYENISLC